MPLKNECRRVGAYDEKAASQEAAISFEGQVSRTQQSQAADTDINGIVKRFKVTGVVPQGVRVPTFGDFDNVYDFRSAMDALLAAERSFMEMPSSVRNRFGNDPQLFLEFCSDEKNLEEMRKMGLAVPKAEEPAPMRVEVVNPVSAPEAS